MNADRLEWLNWRRKGLGSSDMPVVMGVSPWKTRMQLWEEKTSIEEIVDEPSSFIMDKGNELEPIARNYFSAMWGIQEGVEEPFSARLMELPGVPFLRASLDGCSSDSKIILEIKYQGRDPHNAVSQGLVPEKYYPQVQHGLMVSQAERAFFVSINDDLDKKWTHVDPDPAYMSMMFREAVAFWALVQSGTPPELVDADYKALRYKGAASDAREFISAQAENNSSARFLAIQYEILKRVTHPRMRMPGLKIVKGEITCE